MTQSGFFIKRGEKIVGPHSLAQIKALGESFKIKASDLISPSKNGPWSKYADIEPRLFGKQSQAQSAASPPPNPKSKTQPQTGADLTLVDCPHCRQKIPTQAEVCHHCGSSVTEAPAEEVEVGVAVAEESSEDSGRLGFDDVSIPPSFPASTNLGSANLGSENLPNGGPTGPGHQVPVSPYARSLATPRSNKQSAAEESENLSLGNGRWLIPWRAESDGVRYWSLKNYLAISSFLAKLTYVLLLALLVFHLISGGFYLWIGLSQAEGITALSFTLGTVVAIVAVAIYVILWFAFAHLVYMALMAFVDFIRVLIDIEKNTR